MTNPAPTRAPALELRHWAVWAGGALDHAGGTTGSAIFAEIAHARIRPGHLVDPGERYFDLGTPSREMRNRPQKRRPSTPTPRPRANCFLRRCYPRTSQL